MATDRNSLSGSGTGSSSSADSYVGSLISLTSKSEIRYEGILFNINTDESSIGLRNVRSFGTEGRKKDGPQIPPSEKVYEYILFRGSDIKDLLVKSSPPAQSMMPLTNDPAIIQSNYPHPPSTSTTFPSAGSGPLGDLSQSGRLSGSSFQGGMPLYPPSSNLGSWGASQPPGAGGSGVGMPMYWQGYYGAPNGLPHMHQQHLLRPPTLMPISPMQQPMQYPNFNAPAPSSISNLSTSNASDAKPSLLPASNLPTISSVTPASETLPSSTSNVAPSPSLPNASLHGSLTSSTPLTTTSSELRSVVPPVSSKTNATADQTPSYRSSSQSSTLVQMSDSIHNEKPTPTLVTPSQLTQFGSTPTASSQSFQTAHKDVEVVQASSSSSSEITVPVATEAAQPSVLPLPVPSRDSQKPNGSSYPNRYGYRGRERGRAGISRPVTKFTEEFDFEAMNEKFNKDEVWGYLGKSSKSHSTEKKEYGSASDDDKNYQDDDVELQKIEVKPVYIKDDFFDTLSCNALENDSHSGRTRFSEQLKIDTETFGEFARYRGGRGGRGPDRGGYYGGYRYHGRGYGYDYGGKGRGRGRGMSNWTS